jgi:soluble lytic murein transglycosylase
MGKFSQKNKEVTPLTLEPAPKYRTDLGKLHKQKADALASMHLFSLAAEELASAIDHDRPNHAKYLELAQLHRLAENYHQLARLMQSEFWEWIARGDENLPQTFWELAYPLSFSPIVQQFTSSGDLDPFVVFALMFAESVFDPEAYSPAGAMGLMQLMPATGAKMAAAIDIPAPTTFQYFQPKLNIALGTTYLKMLSQLFNRQLPPVIASYNAGEQVVSTWWKDEYRRNEPAFVASIPYKETKRYAQKVLWYYHEYQRIYQ